MDESTRPTTAETGVATTGEPAVRARYNRFIERHEIAWELCFALLAIVFVVVGFVDETPLVSGLEAALTFVFLAEFASRIAASADRHAYLRGHWIDLVALIPTTRGIRLLRLLRLLRLVRAFAGVYRTLVAMSALAQHRGLALLITAWAGVMVICSLALYAAENGTNAAITSPLDALWWGVVTLTTVGYGDVYPVTPEGRLAASVLMLIGIGLFSAITAIFTSFLLSPSAHGARTVAARLRELDALLAEDLVTHAEYATGRERLLSEL